MQRKKRRTYLIIFLVLLLLLILGIVYYFYSQQEPTLQPEPQPTTTDQQQQQPQPEPQPAETTTQQEETESQTAPEATNQTTAKQTARIFVERFSSYSSQNENEHIESVLPLITDEMRDWVEKQTVEQTTEYSGQTTEIIASSVEDSSSDEATVQIQALITQRSDGTESTTQKNGRVELTKVNGSWKVDGFFWE